VYFLGSRSSQVAATQLREAQAARDELIRNQERLLVQLAKDRRLPKENTDLIEHVALLQQDLEETTASLQAEQQWRKESEQEAEKAWDQYEEVTAELADVGIQMQQDASRLYYTLAKEKFGEGPHYAEFEVNIWENDKSETRYFTVETARLEHMPASVFLFLQQVDHGLWDGSSFHINAPHVLLAQPLTPHPVEEQPFNKMERMGLARVPFEEYNEDYTHTAYTLGYGGTELPGPNFYINKLDNTNYHKGEPCFSKVIIGMDTIDRMGQLMGTTENPFYIQPVDITRVRLVQDLNKVHGGTQYLNKNSHHDEH
jgi:cyclophilin family peptidyl-prolyl cis-trans isomerase